MRLARFVTRRVLTGLLSLVVFLFLLFVLIEVLIPGDVASMMRLGLSEAEFQQVRDGLGLSKPVHERFLAWLGGFAAGSIAKSF